MFSRSDLTMLMDATPSPSVSLYLPTHVRGAETRQDPIRLKNLIAAGTAKPGICRLKPAEVHCRWRRTHFWTLANQQGHR